MLKQLEVEMVRVESADQQLQKAEIRNLYQKKELIELEDQANEMDLNKSRSKTSGSVDPSRNERTELPAITQKFNSITANKRNLSTSRSKTSSANNHLYDYKHNRTEFLSKPTSSESDVGSIISQPAAKGYFRSSRRISDRNARTALAADKPSELVFHNI